MDRFRSPTLARCWILLAIFAFSQQTSAFDHFMAPGDVSTVIDVSQDKTEAQNPQAASSPCHGSAQHNLDKDIPGQNIPNKNGASHQLVTQDASETSVDASGSCCESGCLMGTCHASSAALFAVSLFSADTLSGLPYSPIVASRIERSASLFRPPIFS